MFLKLRLWPLLPRLFCLLQPCHSFCPTPSRQLWLRQSGIHCRPSFQLCNPAILSRSAQSVFLHAGFVVSSAPPSSSQTQIGVSGLVLSAGRLQVSSFIPTFTLLLATLSPSSFTLVASSMSLLVHLVGGQFDSIIHQGLPLSGTFPAHRQQLAGSVGQLPATATSPPQHQVGSRVDKSLPPSYYHPAVPRHEGLRPRHAVGRLLLRFLWLPSGWGVYS